MNKKLMSMFIVGILSVGLVGCNNSNKEEESAKEQQRIEQQQEEARIQEEKEQEAIEELREHPVVVVASEPCIGGEYRIFDNTVHDNDGCNELRSRDIIAGYSDDEKFKDCVLCPKCFENAPSKKLGEIYEY